MGTSSQTLNATWEWADGRKPERFVVVRVESVRKDEGGPLGVGRSPSIAGALPDAVKLEGKLIHGAGARPEMNFTLTLPGLEAVSIAAGDRVALGMAASNVCICVAKAPPDVTDPDLEKWLAKVVCKP